MAVLSRAVSAASSICSPYQRQKALLKSCRLLHSRYQVYRFPSTLLGTTPHETLQLTYGPRSGNPFLENSLHRVSDRWRWCMYCTSDNIIETNDLDTSDSAEATREEHTKSMIKQIIAHSWSISNRHRHGSVAKRLSWRLLVRRGIVVSLALFLTLRIERVEFHLGTQSGSGKQSIRTENDSAIVLRSRETWTWGILGQGRRFRLRTLVSVEVFHPFPASPITRQKRRRPRTSGNWQRQFSVRRLAKSVNLNLFG